MPVVNTHLFTIVPYAFATLSVLSFGILSDRLNTKAPFLFSTYVFGSIGYIILLTTTNPVAGIVASLAEYAVSKAGIANWTRAMAQQLIERGIRVNGVAPGPIWTPLQPAFVPNEKIEHFGEQTPIGRAGQPVELAPAYVFLASQESSYVVGETIAVTGGMPVT